MKSMSDLVLTRRTYAIQCRDLPDGPDIMADHDIEGKFFEAVEKIPGVIECYGGMSAMTLAYWIDVEEVSEEQAEKIKKKFIQIYNRFITKGRK